MFHIKLKNGKKFTCENDITIFNAAIKAGIFLEHSCLLARCRSCIVKVNKGETLNENEEFILSDLEKKEGYILSCNSKPISDIELDIEDLGDVILNKKKILPCKIDKLEKLSSDVLKVTLRLPPTINFEFIPGQYINVIKNNIKRSYSIANNSKKDSKIELLIKQYKNGLMSNYWFENAKENDLLRIEGPLGTFFYRASEAENIIFLATGTGIAPIKAILEQINESEDSFKNKKIWIIWGGRYFSDLFWEPEIKASNVNFIKILSRPDENWNGKSGYVQDVVLKELISLKDAQVYACGSIVMISSSKKLLTKNGLLENNFYSDAFVSSN